MLLMTISCGTNKALRCSKGKSNRKIKRYSIKQKKRKTTHFSYSAGKQKKSTLTQHSTSSKTSKTASNAEAVKPIQEPIQINNQSVTIQIDSIENSQPKTPKNESRITDNQFQKNKDSKRNQTEITSTKPPQKIQKELETKSQQIKTTEQTNQVDSLAFIDYQLRMNKMVRLDDKLFKVEDEINYEHNLTFVPNYSIFLDPQLVENELLELVHFLKKNPNKNISVYGNGGLEVDKSYTYKDIHYQINPRTNETVKVHYGSNHLVYEQILYNLSNIGDERIKRIKEEGLREVTFAKVGQLLYERARAVKKLLIQHGIDKKRIKALRGEYTPYSNHTVRIKIN